MNINNFSHDMWSEITKHLDSKTLYQLKATSSFNKAIIERFFSFKPPHKSIDKIKKINTQLETPDQLKSPRIKGIRIFNLPCRDANTK